MNHAPPQPSPMVARFVGLFNQLNATNLERLAELYSEQAEFIDPLHHLAGLAAISDYFAALYANVDECSFELQGHSGQPGDEVIFWRMGLRHRRLGGGRLILVEGCSHLKYGQRIDYHRDYFDLGAMLYEQLPLVGTVIRAIKKRVVA